jgi:hypothetical protein
MLPKHPLHNQQGEETMSRFIVDLGNMRLTDAQKDTIAGAIQQAVLAHLASHHAAAGAATAASALSGNYSLIPIKWRGQIWRPTIAELGQAEDQIAAFANQQVP